MSSFFQSRYFSGMFWLDIEDGLKLTDEEKNIIETSVLIEVPPYFFTLADGVKIRVTSCTPRKEKRVGIDYWVFQILLRKVK